MSACTCVKYLELPGEQVGDDYGEAAEHGRQKYTHFTNVNGDVQVHRDVVEEGRREHQA